MDISQSHAYVPAAEVKGRSSWVAKGDWSSLLHNHRLSAVTAWGHNTVTVASTCTGTLLSISDDAPYGALALSRLTSQSHLHVERFATTKRQQMPAAEHLRPASMTGRGSWWQLHVKVVVALDEA